MIWHSSDIESVVAELNSNIEKGLSTQEAAERLAALGDVEPSEIGIEIANYACQFVGNPYKWGGTSLTEGADCSGFVLSVYAKYGISLPHHAASQAGCGTKISASEAQPGDLFFYGNGRGINHVGIYIGNGQVVHASSPKTGIKISNASYRNPVCVVRILN